MILPIPTSIGHRFLPPDNGQTEKASLARGLGPKTNSTSRGLYFPRTFDAQIFHFFFFVPDSNAFAAAPKPR